MNVFGNSLKFTTVCGITPGRTCVAELYFFQNGYVHVILRELPRSGDEAPNETKVELVVLDTGKVRDGTYLCCLIFIRLAQGISENFRKVMLLSDLVQTAMLTILSEPTVPPFLARKSVANGHWTRARHRQQHCQV